MSEHLDLDALADVLAGEPEPEHLAACSDCRARLAELAAALPRVTAALADAPLPEMPADLPGRLVAALAAEREKAPADSGGDVLPMQSRRTTRWLPALGAVAAAAVLVTGGVVLTQGGEDRQADSASGAGYAVNDSGTDYTRTGTEITAKLPALLTGSARASAFEAAPTPTAERNTLSGGATTSQDSKALKAPAVPDPLAELRTTAGLAACLNSLTPPGDTGLPLALDYATFEGRPALVVVLPTKQADKVDVFVVPPGCAKADGNVYYFRRLPKP